MSSPDKFWRAMFEVVGHEEWADDPRFKDRRSRVENYDTLAEALQVIFAKGKRDVWLRRLQEKDVPAAPLNTLDEVFEDPQVKSYGFPAEIEHPKMGKIKMVGNAVDLSRTPPAMELPPPVLGEHTDEVLHSLGYDSGTIGSLRQNGVI
jgi:formyl-CoA transferase/CoA:oxalate CoA-transferase